MMSVLTVREVYGTDTFYIKLESALVSCGVMVRLTQIEVQNQENNPQFFFDLLFDPKNENVSPECVVVDRLVRKEKLKFLLNFVPAEKDKTDSDIMVSLHRSNVTGQRVIIADYKEHNVGDYRRTLISGRNFYEISEELNEIDHNIYEILKEKNSNKNRFDKMKNLVEDGVLLNIDDYYLIDFVRFDFEFEKK